MTVSDDASSARIFASTSTTLAMPSAARTRNPRSASTKERVKKRRESSESPELSELEDDEEVSVKSETRRKRKQYDSDDLDEDSDGDATAKKSTTGKGKRKAKASPTKKRSPRKKQKASEDEFDDSDLELKEGQEVVGTVVKAPTTGLGMSLECLFAVTQALRRDIVPPGQISQNTLNFLNYLKDPACNDREWYVGHFSRVMSERNTYSRLPTGSDCMVRSERCTTDSLLR